MNNLIVLLIDGLSPRFLAPHGCTWIDTPTIDWIAGQSVVFQQAIAESNVQQHVLASLLSGIHPGIAEGKGTAIASPLDTLREKGYQLAYFTDASKQLEKGLPDSLFDRVVCLNDRQLSVDSSPSIAETHLASSFARLSTELPSLVSPFVAVVHLSSLGSCWDAPLEVREKYRDEEDPEASSVVAPVAKKEKFDPDEILALSHAYAAQVETLDTCLGFLTNELAEDGLFDNSLFSICGLRGFPIGHSGQFGHHESHVRADAIQVPLLIKPPSAMKKQFGHVRIHRVTSTRNAFAMLLDWAVDESGERISDDVAVFLSGRQSAKPVLIAGESGLAIWTPAWLAIKAEDGVDLFVKPEDRWDVNPVQDRCRWVASEFEESMIDAANKLEKGEGFELEPLAVELMQGLD